jgi:hypothetical protein
MCGTIGAKLNYWNLLYKSAVNVQYGNRRIFHNTIINSYYISITINGPGGLDRDSTEVLVKGSGFCVQRFKGSNKEAEMSVSLVQLVLFVRLVP